MIQASLEERPHYSHRALPPYSFVPGFRPHPVSDPRGHRFGAERPPVEPLQTEQWAESEEYLYGVDLFNFGFYWEAHEAWESLWIAAGRHGPAAIWLKALIKLAAAMVKLREGNTNGAARHCGRAFELLADLSAMLPPEQQTYCGMRLSCVEQVANGISRLAGTAPRTAQPDSIAPYWLELNLT
jgi:predicted metal-dependent hydrolase